jgi:hypothetical protein
MNKGMLEECFKFFTDSLKTFVIERFKEVFKESWVEKSMSPPGKDSIMHLKKNPDDWDLGIIVQMIHDHWDHVFNENLGPKFPKSMLTVVRHYRNSWAHQGLLEARDIHRVVDLMQNILEKIGLNTGTLNQRRLELLSSMTPAVDQLPNPLRMVSCNGCNKTLHIKYTFDCNNCFLIGCLSCMKDYSMKKTTQDPRWAFACPRCERLLSEFDKEKLFLLNKYSN